MAEMADHGGGKRVKTADEDDINAEFLRRRNVDLESENAHMRSQIVQLRRCGRLSEGNHEALPVVAATVDLSRIDSSIVSQVCSLLGKSRELFNLTLTCKSFGWCQPTRQLSTLNLSLVEEVAHQAVCSTATAAEMCCLPAYVSGTTSWLSILHRYEHLLMFDVLMGGDIEHQNGDKTTVQATCDDRYCAAVSSSYPMTSGTHYSEFEIIAGVPYIGIVRPMPGLDTEGNYPFHREFYRDFLAQRSEDWGDSTVHACEYLSQNGKMYWTNWGDEDNWGLDWEGRESCRTGDTVGLLLNLDKGTLTVYKNNRRLGLMKNDLNGSYCWFVTLFDDDTVALKKGKLPRGAM